MPSTPARSRQQRPHEEFESVLQHPENAPFSGLSVPICKSRLRIPFYRATANTLHTHIFASSPPGGRERGRQQLQARPAPSLSAPHTPNSPVGPTFTRLASLCTGRL